MAGAMAALNNSYSRVSDTNIIWVRLFQTASQTESHSEQQDTNTIQHQKKRLRAFYLLVCIIGHSKREKPTEAKKTAPLPMMRAAAIQHRQSRSPKRAYLRTINPHHKENLCRGLKRAFVGYP